MSRPVDKLARLRVRLYRQEDLLRRAAEVLRGTVLGGDIAAHLRAEQEVDLLQPTKDALRRGVLMERYATVTEALRRGVIAPAVGARLAAESAAELDVTPIPIGWALVEALRGVWPAEWRHPLLRHALVLDYLTRGNLRAKAEAKQVHEVPSAARRLRAWARKYGRKCSHLLVPRVIRPGVKTLKIHRHVGRGSSTPGGPWVGPFMAPLLSCSIGASRVVPVDIQYLLSLRVYTTALRSFEAEVYLASPVIRRGLPTNAAGEPIPTYDARRAAIQLLLDKCCLICGEPKPGLSRACKVCKDLPPVLRRCLCTTEAYLHGLRPAARDPAVRAVWEGRLMSLFSTLGVIAMTRSLSKTRQPPELPQTLPSGLTRRELLKRLMSDTHPADLADLWVRNLPQLEQALGQDLLVTCWEQYVGVYPASGCRRLLWQIASVGGARSYNKPR